MLAMTDTTQKWQPFTWIGMEILLYLVLLSLGDTWKKGFFEEYTSDGSYL